MQRGVTLGERARRIELPSSAWKAEVLTIELRPRPKNSTGRRSLPGRGAYPLTVRLHDNEKHLADLG